MIILCWPTSFTNRSSPNVHCYILSSFVLHSICCHYYSLLVDLYNIDFNIKRSWLSKLHYTYKLYKQKIDTKSYPMICHMPCYVMWKPNTGDIWGTELNAWVCYMKYHNSSSVTTNCRSFATSASFQKHAEVFFSRKIWGLHRFSCETSNYSCFSSIKPGKNHEKENFSLFSKKRLLLQKTCNL